MCPEVFSCVTRASARRLLVGGFDVVFLCLKISFLALDFHQNLFLFLILLDERQNLSSVTLKSCFTFLMLVTEGV